MYVGCVLGVYTGVRFRFDGAIGCQRAFLPLEARIVYEIWVANLMHFWVRKGFLV